MSKAGYVIIVGSERPATAQRGEIDPKTHVPRGETFEMVIPVGAHLMINKCRVWGRRVMRDKDGKIANGKGDFPELVEAITPKYLGEIEFLEWGKPGGYAIEIRYLDQSKSLDVEYQDNIQKVKIADQGGAVHLELHSGENKFDYDTQALLIQHLKVHAQNLNSTSKNPNPAITGYTFKEVSDDEKEKTSRSSLEAKGSAINIVTGLASHPGSFRALFEVLGERKEFGNIDKLSLDQQVYSALLKFADAKPLELVDAIGAYKRSLQELFSLAESHNALDLTKNGFIALMVNGKPEIMYEAEGKGKDMIDWVFDNAFEESVYQKSRNFKERIQSLK